MEARWNLFLLASSSKNIYPPTCNRTMNEKGTKLSSLQRACTSIVQHISLGWAYPHLCRRSVGADQSWSVKVTSADARGRGLPGVCIQNLNSALE
ncbi:hypothetical protein PGT21_000869 [Puccinia graminis f. sp. tritici]|uniref:Uncharacterized protein n=1 Tax=Puccinia graminis f. sp. tritici TaxID=56615 RepID=A0A5B0Q1I7_PUCGR|nr:hypothetical protein PGT21_000869 [Puccinia graminis f. sp. tritici]